MISLDKINFITRSFIEDSVSVMVDIVPENNYYEIKRNILNKDGSALFCVKLKSFPASRVLNVFDSLVEDLKAAKTIEMAFPGEFSWFFDGKNIRTLAFLPSHDLKYHGLLSRYGGVTNFLKVLKRHLSNIIKAEQKIATNLVFGSDEPLDKYITAIGSINKSTGLFSVPIKLTMDMDEILKITSQNFIVGTDIPYLNLDFWKKELNPDILVLEKPVLSRTISAEFCNYPDCIKNLMALEKKSDSDIRLLVQSLLHLHNKREVKHVLRSVLTDAEYKRAEKIFNILKNHLDNFSFPTCDKLKRYCSGCNLNHPLEYYK